MTSPSRLARRAGIVLLAVAAVGLMACGKKKDNPDPQAAAGAAAQEADAVGSPSAIDSAPVSGGANTLTVLSRAHDAANAAASEPSRGGGGGGDQ
jgi:predicted outer membrane protein